MKINVERALLGLAAGALLVRAMRNGRGLEGVAHDLRKLESARSRAHEQLNGLARTAVGCTQTAGCTCILCKTEARL